MVRTKVNFWMIAAFVIGILFLSCVVYISVSKYKQARDADRSAIFESGVWQGYQFAIGQIVQSSEECNPVSVTYQNETTQFISTDCLASR